MATPCNAIARSGNRCSAPVLAGSRYCYLHDPATADRWREAARKGGRNRANAARAARLVPATMTPSELGGWFSALLKSVIAGQTSPQVATAAAAIARVLLAVNEMAIVEDRLAELEAATFGRDRRKVS
jgi:hypothetical protein